MLSDEKRVGRLESVLANIGGAYTFSLGRGVASFSESTRLRPYQRAAFTSLRNGKRKPNAADKAKRKAKIAAASRRRNRK